MSFNAFVKKSENIDISFFLYADQNIDLFLHGESEETIKAFIDQRNQFLRNLSNDFKEEQDFPKEENNNLISKDDLEKLSEEKVKENKSLEIKDETVQILFKKENLFEVKIKVKQPNSSEVTNMISESTLVTKEGLKIDLNKYNETRVHYLLKNWNFTKINEDGTSSVVPVNDKNISELHPKVFNALVFYINTKIDLYLENLL